PTAMATQSMLVPVTQFVQVANLTGGTAADTFRFVGDGAFLTGPGLVDGGAQADDTTRNTIVGPDFPRGLNITRAAARRVQALNLRLIYATFQNLGTLTGGSAADRFVLQTAGSLSGTLDGGSEASTQGVPQGFSGFSLQLLDWGDGSKVPTSGYGLVILG